MMHSHQVTNTWTQDVRETEGRTCWHTALSWSGCRRERAEVTGTAWK